MVLSGGIRAGLVLMAVTLSACGSPSPTRTASPTATPVPTPRPSAAVGACASVTTTTPIEQVPAACAALWAPYGVTKVPPANLTDSTPVTHNVVNATNSALTDAQVAQWLLASNRDSIWFRWAEANDQVPLMSKIGSVSLNAAVELQAMAAGEPVDQPDCAIFPTRVKVFQITSSERQFFINHGQSVADSFVFAAEYPGACNVTAKGPNGVVTLEAFPTPGTTFFASHIVDDPLLGELLYYDGSGNCAQAGAPPEWCG